MATLLMRTPELAVEKLSMANIEHGRLQQEKVAGHGEHEGHQKASSEGRSRARKGKNAQKKQPQRGLGVAQLEKLRLQEQSKQEAACLASLQGLPPFGFTDQNGGICFRPMKSGTMSHQPGHSSALSFCNGRTGPSSHYLAGDGRQLVSLANSDHSTAGSLARHAHGGPSVAIMLPRNREMREHSYGCTSLRTVPSLTSLSERPGSRSCGTSGYVEESPGRLASCRLACLGSPPSSTAKSSLYSRLTTGVNLVDSLASNAEQEVQRLSEADRESVHVFQAANNGVGDAGMIDTKFFPVVGKNGAGSLFTSSNIQCFESSSGPPKSCRRPQDPAEVPVAGVPLNCGRPKELSSFQSFSSNNTWSATEKTRGQKRPWYDLDLNSPAGEVEVAQGGCYAGVAQCHESPGGAHHITRSGFGNTLPLLKDKACANWQENEVQNLSATTDVGFHSMESFLKVSCPSQSRVKDCCSSVCSPCGSPVTRRRCLSSPEAPVVMGVDHDTSGDFLTLGLSSRSYPTSPQLGVEVDSKESMSPEAGHQVQRMGAEVGSSLQLQMSNRHQESAPSVTGGVYSPSCTDSFFSAVGLSCRFTSTSSSNMTEDCHEQAGSKEKRELDLSLKLAL